MRVLISAVAVCILIPTVHADELYTQCIDTTVRNDEWARCGGEWVKREEAKMTEVLDRFLEVAGDERRPDMQSEQDAWSAYRQAACHMYDTGLGREGQVLGYPGCIANLVIARTKQLEYYLDELGGR